MKVVKKVNNNIAICIDANGNELIAFGNGIGFPKTPYEINDLSKITRTFYGVNPNYLDMLNDIPEDVFEISARIVDYAKMKIQAELNPNVVFTLADHINFAIQRYEKKMNIKMPFLYDIEHLYEAEMEVGKKAIRYINKIKKIHLCGNEAFGIALHFINAENIKKHSETGLDEKKIRDDITKIIEHAFDLKINRRSFNYSRFVTHMQYLLKRQMKDTCISSENMRLFDSMIDEFPKTHDCVLQVKAYIKSELNWTLNNEELLYLMLHINRLCSREDCNH